MTAVCEQFAKYAAKAVAAGLAEAGAPLFEILGGRFLLCRPRDPYRAMIALLAARSDGRIVPKDAEARAILVDLPVARSAGADDLAEALAGRRAAALADGDLVLASATAAAAFDALSSACFACYVKLVAEALAAQRSGAPLVAEERRALAIAFGPGRRPELHAPKLARGPFEDAGTARAAVTAAGRATVELGLVGASFGNASYLVGGSLHISETGAPLDELEGRIVSVPLGRPGPGARSASSELPAHMGIVERTGARAVLHGHPRHAVIVSLDRGDEGEGGAGGAPIVPGRLLSLPEALANHPVAIAHGHGAFATGRIDFDTALQALLDVERACFDEIAGRLS
jgi:hypothetical protein